MNGATSATGWVRNPDGTLGWTWNPITGCLNHDNGLCKGGGFPCYAYRLAHGRLKARYLANTNLAPDAKGGVSTLSIGNQSATEREGDYADPFYPRFWEERLDELKPKKGRRFFPMRKPKGIFVCDMSDLFGIGIPEEWTRKVLNVIGRDFLSADRLYLLTKQAQNLPQWSPFPENCWVGVTATNHFMFVEACLLLGDIQAKVKYISLEPLLSWGDIPADATAINQWATGLKLYGINWLIIGACTGRSPELLKLQQQYPSLTLMPYGHQWTLQPRIEDLREIIRAADKAGIPVFQKDNLKPLYIANTKAQGQICADYILRQELPDEDNI